MMMVIMMMMMMMMTLRTTTIKIRKNIKVTFVDRQTSTHWSVEIQTIYYLWGSNFSSIIFSVF